MDERVGGQAHLADGPVRIFPPAAVGRPCSRTGLDVFGDGRTLTSEPVATPAVPFAANLISRVFQFTPALLEADKLVGAVAGGHFLQIDPKVEATRYSYRLMRLLAAQDALDLGRFNTP